MRGRPLPRNAHAKSGRLRIRTAPAAVFDGGVRRVSEGLRQPGSACWRVSLAAGRLQTVRLREEACCWRIWDEDDDETTPTVS